MRRVGRLGGAAYGLVVSTGYLGDLRLFGGNGGHRRRVHALRDEDVGALPEQACDAGQGPAVVPVGGGHQGDGAGLFSALGVFGMLGEDAVDRPGRAQHLERGQPQTARLVLDEDPAYPQLRCQLG